MENITIGQIISVMGTLTIIVGFFVAIFKWYKSHITDEFDGVKKRLSHVEKAQERFKEEVDNSKAERAILLRGELSALKGLSEMGCNGSVSQSITEIEQYIIKKVHD